MVFLIGNDSVGGPKTAICQKGTLLPPKLQRRGQVLHRGGKFGCKLVTLFGGYSNDGVSIGIWVIHTGPKSGGSR